MADVDLVKSGIYDDANGDGLENVGDRVLYSFTATNVGNVTLSDATISDPLVPSLSFTPAAPATLAPGRRSPRPAPTRWRRPTSTTAASPTRRRRWGRSAGAQYTHTDSDVQNFNQITDIDLIKTGAYEDANGDGVENAGDRVLYEFIATNIGTVTLTGVTITDPTVGPLDFTPAAPATLLPGETLAATAGVHAHPGRYRRRQPHEHGDRGRNVRRDRSTRTTTATSRSSTRCRRSTSSRPAPTTTRTVTAYRTPATASCTTSR